MDRFDEELRRQEQMKRDQERQEELRRQDNERRQRDKEDLQKREDEKKLWERKQQDADALKRHFDSLKQSEREYKDKNKAAWAEDDKRNSQEQERLRQESFSPGINLDPSTLRREGARTVWRIFGRLLKLPWQSKLILAAIFFVISFSQSALQYVRFHCLPMLSSSYYCKGVNDYGNEKPSTELNTFTPPSGPFVNAVMGPFDPKACLESVGLKSDCYRIAALSVRRSIWEAQKVKPEFGFDQSVKDKKKEYVSLALEYYRLEKDMAAISKLMALNIELDKAELDYKRQIIGNWASVSCKKVNPSAQESCDTWDGMRIQFTGSKIITTLNNGNSGTVDFDLGRMQLAGNVLSFSNGLNRSTYKLISKDVIEHNWRGDYLFLLNRIN